MNFKSGLLKEYSNVVSIIARFIDVFLIFIAAYLAYVIRFHSFAVDSSFIVAICFAELLVLFIFPLSSIYASWRGMSVWNELGRVSVAWFSVFMLLSVLALMTQAGGAYSRYWVLYFFIFAWCFLLIFRLALRWFASWLRKKGFNRRNIVILGAGDLGQAVVKRLSKEAWAGLYILGYFDDNSVLQGKSFGDYAVLGRIDELESFIKSEEEVDEVWIALPMRCEAKIRSIINTLSQYPSITVRFVPDIFGFALMNYQVTEIAGMPVLNVNQSPMVGINRLIKGLEDRILGLLILILISPAMLVIALLIKLESKGPVFFVQKRHGNDGKYIDVYKFRTMFVHEDVDVKQAQRNDVRVTRFGGLLRRTSLDELPQFINVLQGRMSIVGPRPHAIVHNEKYRDLITSYMQRHKVKPGITGWAQVNGLRGETDTVMKMRLRVEHDLYYIEHWSLIFDLKIILMTIIKGFIDKNAY